VPFDFAQGKPADSAQGKAESLACAACGSPIPDRRGRCGRCGSTATTTVPTSSAAASLSRSQLLVIGVGVFLLVGVAIALTSGSNPSASAAAKTSPSAANRTASTDFVPRKTDVDAPPAPDDVTSADFSRTGLAAYTSGDLASAEAKLKAAVVADGQNAEALNNLGQVLVRAGKAREAIAYFDRAIAISDGVWTYHFNRARAYSEMQNWAQAIAGYNDAVRLFPGDYVTHFNLAKAREASGDLPGAVESYGKAAELAPGQGEFQLWYGRALDRTGRQQEAVSAYRKFLELEPDAPQAEKVKARLAQLGDPSAGAPARTS
jgi:tetratricopeptide (TPR) repeat protein